MRKQSPYESARRAALTGGLGLCLFAVSPWVLAAEPAPGAKLKSSPAPRVVDHRATIIRVLDEAMRTMNMKFALARHGSSLSASEKSALLGITPVELAHLKSARAKLKAGLK